MSKYYVTTSIPYVNAEPHLGHAMEFIQADVLARYHRQIGDTVLFSTGTDEHGSKIAEKANEKGVTVKQFVDENVASFVELLKNLNITNDLFVRTTDVDHEKRVQIVWNNLKEHIYKNSYIGLYCVGCEEFVSDKVAKQNNNSCPVHNRPYEQLEEENYFFSLSKFTDQIKSAIDSNQFLIVPDTRRNEILSVLEEGLEDISISRSSSKVSWGVNVPGDDTQVMYVWFDALLNYITVLGYPDGQQFKEFWPADTQIIGKDILRFHAAIWPGILLGLNLPLPSKLYVHGFITSDGQKMSKSLGNSIAPQELIDLYGADAVRYYFLRHIPSYSDGDYTAERFAESFNNELANELGNAVQRVAAMISKYQNNIIGDIPAAEHDVHEYHESIKNFRFDKALDEVWNQVRGLNQYIDVEKPWQIAKENDSDHLREVLAYCVSNLLEIAGLLAPFLPNTATQIANMFKDGIVRPIPQPLFPKLDI
jgi:methionyl-tRNA synthetase